MIKKELRYIRYRICRSIYYADQCPMDNRKSYSSILKNLGCAVATGLILLVMMFIFVLMA